MIVGLAITIWRAIATRGEERTDWLIFLGFMGISMVVVMLQLRGVRFAAMFALPAAVWLITRARTYLERRPGSLNAARLIGAWLLVSSAGHYAVLASFAWLMPAASYVPTVLADLDRKESCIAGSTYDKIAALPPSRVIVPFNLGPNILLYSPHSTVSAGFHRNVKGTTEVTQFFAGDEATARRIADERNLDYVAVCSGEEEYDGLIGPTEGARWSWLTPVSGSDEPLQIYRIER